MTGNAGADGADGGGATTLLPTAFESATTGEDAAAAAAELSWKLYTDSMSMKVEGKL